MPARSVSWIASIGIALLTGLVALLAGGVVAEWCVSWYRISSFEGGSGYFVAFMALASGVGGTLVGLIVARAVAAAAGMNALKALGLAVACVLSVAGGVAGVARLVADVPPEIDGERLYLLVEIRWPDGQRPPAPDAGAASIRLGTLSGSRVRREEAGPLFLEDARLEGTQWVVPGVVEIFTSRGTPVLSAFVGDTQITSLLPPLRRYPRREDQAWSEWQPAAPDGQPAIGTPVSYRYRVSPRSAPARWQVVGPLAIETRISQVFNTEGTAALSAQGTFDIRYRGQVVPGLREPDELAVISTTPIALLARSRSSCQLVKVAETGVVVIDAPPCHDDGPSWRLGMPAAPKPSGAGLAPPAGRVTARPPRGWLDRETFREPGLYLLGPALLDTRSLTVVPRGWPAEPPHQPDVPPIGLSPDQRSMVWVSPGNGYDEAPTIATMRLDTGATATLPIDRRRMRYRTPELDIDGGWLAHHFAWVTGEDGADRLAARTDFVPLAYRGALSEPTTGGYQSYTIGPGGARLHAAVVDILVKELHASRLEEEYATVGTPRVAVDGMPVSVQYVDGDSAVSIHAYKSQPEIMARIAAHLDGILASGRLDDLLVEDPD